DSAVCSRCRRYRFRRCRHPLFSVAAAVALFSVAAAVAPSSAATAVACDAISVAAACDFVVAAADFRLSLGTSCPLVIAMAEEMSPKIDVAFDTSSTPKSENLPVQVTSIRLNKDNYLSWSAALEIGITSRGHLPYITGEKPAPNIQPLILRKSTSYDMWTVLARMYGRKKRVLRTYQIKRNIYSLKQGDLSVASFYAALKTKWEELDYHVNDDWHCGPDHALYWEKEWMDRTFIFLGGLRDEYESIRSQILNCDEIPGIEDVYARVESEEQRRQVMHIDSSHGSAPSAFVSRSSVTGQRPVRRCSHCNKSGHSVDFCWDIHPEKRLVCGRPPSSRRDTVSEDKDSQMEGGPVEEQSRNHLFGQVYNRKKKDVVEDVDITNPNLASSPDDPSPMNEELPIALRKGTSEDWVAATCGGEIVRITAYSRQIPTVASRNVMYGPIDVKLGGDDHKDVGNRMAPES
ncbi:hypothetical protein EJ110_NYTH20492, partial [Nymphaea thermarum]